VNEKIEDNNLVFAVRSEMGRF